ncbi:MAG: hypothetical protein INR62_08770 [Rhodospirillales bacterium]|nr:hypothetical protein [Acetobacter sp.]
MNRTAKLFVVTTEETSVHSRWEKAAAHVAAVVPVRIGECLRFRQTREGVFVLSGRPRKRQQGVPLAWVTDPASYKIAQGCGDLSDVPDFFRRRAVATLSGPPSFPVSQPMTPAQADPVIYVVLENATPGVVWRSRVYPVGALVGIATANEAEERKFGRYLAAGFLRVATAAEKQISAMTAATAAAVQRPRHDEGRSTGASPTRPGRPLFPALCEPRPRGVLSVRGAS